MRLEGCVIHVESAVLFCYSLALLGHVSLFAMSTPMTVSGNISKSFDEFEFLCKMSKSFKSSHYNLPKNIFSLKSHILQTDLCAQFVLTWHDFWLQELKCFLDSTLILCIMMTVCR